MVFRKNFSNSATFSASFTFNFFLFFLSSFRIMFSWSKMVFFFSNSEKKETHLPRQLVMNALARALKKARILNAGCQILKFHRLTD